MTTMKDPWQCPFCKVVYAPFMPSCRCQAFKDNSEFKTVQLDQPIFIKEPCVHVWDHTLTAPTCKNCGAYKASYILTTTQPEVGPVW